MKICKFFKYTILILCICAMIIFCLQPIVRADIDISSYSDIKADNSDALLTRFDGLITLIATIGSLASVIMIAVLGIRFMMGSLEEKAEYKERMPPYLIGATFVFAITRIVDIIKTVTEDISSAGDVEAMGGKIITIVLTIGSMLSVIVLVSLGIKYMHGGTEDRAEYRKSLVPYIIGCIFVFSASTLAGVVYQLASHF